MIACIKLFHTRWVMSYLRGPLTRDQVKQLMSPLKGKTAAFPPTATAKATAKSPFATAPVKAERPILPSEIEGFGLPALEAFYLGTPVCFVENTSVEEILSVATSKGRFSLKEPGSLFRALDEVLAMSAEEVRACGLKLRDEYATEKIAARLLRAFREVSGCGQPDHDSVAGSSRRL